MANAAFNRGVKYNRAPYSTRYVMTATLAFNTPGVGSFDATITGSFVLDSKLVGNGGTLARLSRDDKLNALLAGFGSLNVSVNRLRFNTAELSGFGSLDAGSEIFTILRYLGEVAVGDVVVFDSCENLISLNSNYQLEDFIGQLLTLEPGSYQLEYSDGEASRSVQVDIEYTNSYK